GSDNAQQVVAAAAAAQRGVIEGGEQPGVRAAYYSADAGTTWSRGTFTDPNGQTPDVGSITSVIYSPATHLFYAAYRFHGFYSSGDGTNWSRIPTQPGPLASALCPASVPNPSTATCPLYRGEMAIQPS